VSHQITERDGMKRGATYGLGGIHGIYRLILTREWGPGPSACFIGHNPSTATHEAEDPTTLAWAHFARENGFGRYVAVNLYPFRSSDPAACRAWVADWDKRQAWDVRDALMMNESVVVAEAKKADRVVACWGALAQDWNWVEHVVEAIQSGEAPYPDIFCLGLTASGAPKHPLARGHHRIPRNQTFVVWRREYASTRAA
jgi:hypothetical protein